MISLSSKTTNAPSWYAMRGYMNKVFKLLRGGAPEEHFPDATDWHCHILPGVDDGFRQTEESLEILRRYERAGIAEVWLTPHIMEDVPNTTAHLRDTFARFQAAYADDFALRHPEGRNPVRLHLAAENMLDALFGKRLKAGDLLPLSGNRLLVETSIFSAPANFRFLLERIKNAGYTPVLAHPERYLYMSNDDYEELKAQGILFQRNLFSLRGQYGDRVRKRARWLQKHKMYDLVGSDLHNIPTFERYW